MSRTVLVVDDDPQMCRMLEKGLKTVGFDTVTSTDPSRVLERLQSAKADVVVTDVRMPGVNGIDLCTRIAQNRPDVPVIVITAFGDMHLAIDALRAGAYDFVAKPFNMETIRHAVRRAATHRELSRKVERLEHALQQDISFDRLVGGSPAMRELSDLVARVARVDSPVLITGESGTGKELVAQALHRHGSRKDGPFVPVNCAAIPEGLLESELFGHTKGAFTGASSDSPGLFRQAHRGTLFLDEIGELPLQLQPKLLRAIQERAVRPVGSGQSQSFDTRIIAATNQDLEAAVEEGRFREDLYYRIHVVEIDVPPLRLRDNDILVLARHFLGRFAASANKEVEGILPAAAAKLLKYDWPGNVRELQSCIERAVALCRHSQITIEDLPKRIRDYEPSTPTLQGDASYELVPMAEVERRHVLRVFEATGRNQSRAAKILGFDRKTLYRKLRQYGALPRSEETDVQTS